jgi:predicted alpha/beta-hydrolase family hydrolase
MSVERSELRFEASPDAGDVSAILLRPPDARAVLVLGHGAGAGMRHRFMEGMATALGAAGVATLRYQFPYVEAGRRRPDRTPRLVATVRAAARAAEAMAHGLPGGKSMGGRMTSIAAAEAPLPGVLGLVFLGFPLHRPGDPSDARADHLAGVRLPMLFLQGTRDRLAELDRIERVVRELGDRATLDVIDDADHGFDVPKRAGVSAEEVYAGMAGSIGRWLATVLPG